MVLEKANMDIRQKMQEKGVKQWELAYLVGVSKYTISTWLQVPLTQDRRERIQRALDTINND